MRAGVIVVLGLLGAHAAQAADGPMPLKPGAGQESASVTCNICHTSDYIIMNSRFLSADAWKAEVTKMRTAFGAPLDDATAVEIQTYLAENYGAPKTP